MDYQVADYTTMGSTIINLRRDGTGTPIDELQTGGFGDYVDFNTRFNPVCISHDYTDKITCWHLTPGGGAVVGNSVERKFRTGWPIRSLTGYYESSFFAVCGRKWIKVFNIWDQVSVTAPVGYNVNHVAIHEEGTNGGDLFGSIISNDFNHQIWDLIYINTNSYVADSVFIGNGGTPYVPLLRPRYSNPPNLVGPFFNAWDTS
jgi:hypothetical protein